MASETLSWVDRRAANKKKGEGRIDNKIAVDGWKDRRPAHVVKEENIHFFLKRQR